MRVTSNGRVTIPKAIRDRFGFHPGADVEFVTNGKAVYVVKASASRGEKLVLRMRGAAGPGMTTDEVIAMTRGQ
jgi:AbrB family looped-hinge helix DNA binding protein